MYILSFTINTLILVTVKPFFMKKYFSAIILIALCFSANAQDDLVITGTKKITKELTPQQIIDSLEKRFPNAKSVQYYQVPASGVSNGWSVTEDDNMDVSQEVDYYTLKFKNNKLNYWGLYSSDGTLLQAKIEEKAVTLPTAVKNSLMAIKNDYPGYKVISKNYYKNQNYKKSKEYYQVSASNGTTVKHFYYEPNGTLIKVK